MPANSVCEDSHVSRSSSGRTCQGKSEKAWSKRGPIRGRVVSRAFRAVLAAAGLLVMCAGYEVVAEEAGTSPTCTGCDGSSQGSPSRPKTFHPKPSASKKAKPVAARALVSSNGSWSGASTGPCIPTWPWTLQVSNGVISGSGTNGHVSPAGVWSGKMVVLGTAYNFVGQTSGSRASGTWKSVECSGRWSANKS